MDVYASIDIEIFKLFHSKWEHLTSLSYNKFATEVLKCIILTDALWNKEQEFNEYALPYYFYERIIKKLRPKIDGYTWYRSIMKSLKEEYFYVFIPGYNLSDDRWSYTYYTGNDNFNDIFFQKIRAKKKGYYKVNITKLSKLQKGICTSVFYNYNGTKSTNISELYNKYTSIGKSCEEFNEIKRKIKNECIIEKKLTIGLDECIEGFETKIVKYQPEEYEYTNLVKIINIELVKKTACMSLRKTTDPLYDVNYNRIIKTCREISRNMDESGIVSAFYHGATYGRMMQHGGNLQLLPKEFRKEVLNNYVCVDMDGSYFTLIRNLSKEYKYPHKTPFLDDFFSDAKAYRKKVYEELKAKDPELEYKGVKTCFTAMGYGAHCSEGEVSAAIHFDIKRKNKSGKLAPVKNVIVKNVGNHDKYTAERLVENQYFKGLHDEICAIRKFIVKKIKSSGKNELTNAAGRVMKIDKSNRSIDYIVFLIHGLEVTILMELEKFVKKMCPDIENPIGLLLHDGIYIKRECMNEITLQMLSEHIFQVFGYSVKYSME